MKKLFLIPLLFMLSFTLAQKTDLEFCREKYPDTLNATTSSPCNIWCQSNLNEVPENLLGTISRPNRLKCKQPGFIPKEGVCIAARCEETSDTACADKGEYSLASGSGDCKWLCHRETVDFKSFDDHVLVDKEDGMKCYLGRKLGWIGKCKSGKCINPA